MIEALAASCNLVKVVDNGFIREYDSNLPAFKERF